MYVYAVLNEDGFVHFLFSSEKAASDYISREQDFGRYYSLKSMFVYEK